MSEIDDDLITNCATGDAETILFRLKGAGQTDSTSKFEQDGGDVGWGDQQGETTLSDLLEQLDDYEAGVSPGTRGPWRKNFDVGNGERGVRLRFNFQGDDTAFPSLVMKAASDWSAALHGRIQFEQSNSDSAINVTRSGTENLWSARRNTLFLPGVGNHGASYAIILHEIGHVLGMSHEHFHPGIAIDWKDPAIIADLINDEYGLDGKYKWTDKKVKSNIIDRDNRLACPIGSDYDPKSVMTYAVRRSWNNSGFEMAKNSKISPKDVACVCSLYGFETSN